MIDFIKEKLSSLSYRLELINECKKLGFTLVQNLNKTIFGLYNVMQTDNTLIFLKE